MKNEWEIDMMQWEARRGDVFKMGLIDALRSHGGWLRHYFHEGYEEEAFSVEVTDGVASNGTRYIQFRLYEDGKPVGEEPNEREP